MAAPRNSIGRLTTEILVSGGDAFEEQHRVSGFIKQNLLPLLEKVLDKIGQRNSIIRINKLELNLGAINPDMDGMPDLHNFEQLLEEKLISIIQQNQRHENPEVKELSSEQSNEELFLFLILNGHLPWWVSASQKVELKPLADELLQSAAPRFLNTLREALCHTNTRTRLATQLSLSQLERLMQQLGIRLHEQWINRILATASGSDKEKTLRLVYKTLLNPQFNPMSQSRLAKRVLDENQTNIPVSVIKELTIISESPGESKHETAKENEEPNITSELKNGSEDPENTYYIKNAGLVILSPFLPHYFKALGLCSQEHEFVSPQAAERAVCLLRHLATGQESDFEEHELVFAKVMCGIPIHMPLQNQIRITQNEQDESLNLLKVVTERWTALKNTSPHGMRDAFLFRAGILKRMANGWNLNLERQTLDVLVDRLPWSISVIKLPWIQEVIFVDWT